jgi:hypothetical protein
MRNFVGKFLTSAVLCAQITLGAGGVSAAPTPIGGVFVGGTGETTRMLSDLTESFVTPQTPELFGFGRVTRINDLAGNSLCVSGTCELTYVFRDYFPVAFNVSGPENSVVFIGGAVDFFLDSTPDSSLADATGFEDSDTGSPWLSLAGFESTETTGPNAGLSGTLFSVGTNVLDPARIRGNGDGLLRITGGDAADYFGIGNQTPFISSFQPSPAGWALGLTSLAQFEFPAQGSATQVPEPATLAMLGIGLIAMATVRARRDLRPVSPLIGKAGNR